MAQDVQSALDWVRRNPTDPQADKWRTWLKSKGVPETSFALPGAGVEGYDPRPVTDPDPLPQWLGNVVYPPTQAWAFDVPEAAQQIGTLSNVKPPDVNIPLGPLGHINPETIRERATSTPFRRDLRTFWDVISPYMLAGPIGEGVSLAALGARTAPEMTAAIASKWNSLAPAAQTMLKAIFGAAAQPSEPGGDFAKEEARKLTFGTMVGGAGAKFGDIVGKREAGRTKREGEAAGQNVANRLDYERGMRRASAARAGHEVDLLSTDFRNQLQEKALERAKAEHGVQTNIFAEQKAGAEMTHGLATADFEARKAAIDPSNNLAWMKRALDKVDLGGKTPTVAGDEALNTTRDLIGGKLNEANSQLMFDPIEAGALETAQLFRQQVGGLPGMEPFRGSWERLMDTKVLPEIAEHDPALDRWIEKGPIPGPDFARVITKVRREADRLARGAVYPNPNAHSMLDMADGLNQFADMMEDRATGPEDALKLRQNAREAYRIYGALSAAADPAKGSIATAPQIINELQRRRGGDPARYRAGIFDPKDPGHADAQHATRWRQQSEAAQVATPPDAPLLPPKPVKPKAADYPQEKMPTAPEGTRDPKMPEDVLPRAAPKPTEMSKAGRDLARVAAHALGWQTARALGLPWWYGSALVEGGRAVGPVLGPPISRTMSRNPYAVGAAAGQFGENPAAPLERMGSTLPEVLKAITP